MSRSAGKRVAHRRIQPYTWLGAGALTLGMGAAMVGGTAVAFADAGADSPSSTNSASSDAPSTRAATKAATKAATGAEAPKRRAPHVDRAASAADDPGPGPLSRRNRVPLADVTGGVESAAAAQDHSAAAAVSDNPVADNPAPAAATTPAAPTRRVAGTARQPDAQLPDPTLLNPVPAVQDSPAADPAPAAAVRPAAADPAPNMESWLPSTPIVPGARVTLALKQIEQSKSLITEETWGAGNILAGFGSFGPQAALTSAQLMLGIWAANIGSAREFVANTVGNPLFHSVAQANLQNAMRWPARANASLATASVLITPLGWFGADVNEAKALVEEARQNGKVYAKVPITVKLGTQPMVNVKINDGRRANLLLDTGASGLVTTRDKVGSAYLGPAVGSGDSCFSGGVCYHYETYNTKVDLGDGAVGTAPVNIVTDNDTYPDSVANFKSFFGWGADGILGVGANTAGPGPAPIPTAAMPGELRDGVLIYQNAYPFGLGGYMILGPNPFPTRVSLPGAPDAYVKVSVNDGPMQDAAAIIDSGGVYGTLNRSLYSSPPPVGTEVPAGTKVDVYTADGATLLYSYTTQSGAAATPFIDTGLFNTGNAPYQKNPIYLNYAATPYGIGSTDFSIY